MLTLEQVVKQLKDRKLSIVAEKTGISYNTVWKVAAGRTVDVSYNIVKKLSDYLTESK